MSKFRVQISGGRDDAEYIVHEAGRNNQSTNAAITALITYKDHGHTEFPYHDDLLTLTLEPVEEDV